MMISTKTQNVEMNTKIIWYEKTVEYAFVRKFLETAAMPLSGPAEKVGDTIFNEGNSFFIIEFKKGIKKNLNGSLSDLSNQVEQEKKKYVDINTTMANMSNYSAYSCHYAVYGIYDEKEKDSNEKFKLAFINYLDFIKTDSNNNTQPKILSDLSELKRISNLTEFKEYLQFLINSKKVINGSSSSIDYGNTLIVDKHGTACALSDREGLEELGLEFPTNKLSSDYSSSYSMQ